MATIEWRDGTPYSTDFNDFYYHSGDPFEENGLRETEYLFLQQNNLQQRWQNLPNHPESENKLFVIGETGFGTGLNFLAACDLWLKTAPKDWRLQFISSELKPICKSDLRAIQQSWSGFAELSGELISQYPELTPGIHLLSLANGRIQLYLMLGEANQMLKEIAESPDPALANHQKKAVDAWFLDGFAPTKNPDIWCDKIFSTLASLSCNKTTFATFTAASQVRKGLTCAGFKVNKITGFGKKRESLKGQFVGADKQTTTKATHWYLNKSPISRSRKTALVLGAGIAGCTAASALAKRGFDVTVVDRHPAAGQEGSGNLQAIVYPRLSVQNNQLPRINLTSMTLASRYYQPYWDQGLGAQCGVLLLPESDKAQVDFQQIAERYSDHKNLVTPVDNRQICALSGLDLHAQQGLFFPSLGWLPPQAICQRLLQDINIPLLTADIKSLNHCAKTNLWELHSADSQTILSAETLVIANAFECQQFPQTDFLPVTQLRGQVTHIPSNAQSAALKTVICGKGYIAPANNGLHSCGATYNKGLFSSALRAEDHKANLSTICATDHGIAEAMGSPAIESLTGRANYRCTSKDYLPMVGPVPDVADFKQLFGALRKDATAYVESLGNYLPNLFIHCGLGSRGLSYAPLTAEILAAEISGEIPPLQRELRLAMHPARFLIRDLKRRKI